MGGSLKNKEKPLDHTLPVYYLWPLTTDNATLLCHECNGEKSGKWPSEFYKGKRKKKLKELAVLTGFDERVLEGKPFYNPDAIDALKDPDIVDDLLIRHARNMDNVIRLRNRILKDTGVDFFAVSSKISRRYVDHADSLL